MLDSIFPLTRHSRRPRLSGSLDLCKQAFVTERTLISLDTLDQRPSQPDTGSSSAIVEARNLTFSYRDRRAIDDVSIAFYAGEIFVLMGPNGAGKSSLVRLLTGSLAPVFGSVAVAAAGGDRHAIGLVPQEIALYPWLTARENCRAFARIAGLGRAEARDRTDEALALTRCVEVADVPVMRLSGGTKRRVNIAAALVTRPAFLILDEPTVGVDLEARRAIAQTIRALKTMGMAILIVTHDFAEADGLADRAGFLANGQLIAEGAPREMIAAVFGARKRIEIVLPTPPDEIQRAGLTAEGAVPTGHDTVWIAYSEIDGWDGRAFADALSARGVAIGELRLRDPGLEALYARLCPEERAQ